MPECAQNILLLNGKTQTKFFLDCQSLCKTGIEIWTSEAEVGSTFLVGFKPIQVVLKIRESYLEIGLWEIFLNNAQTVVCLGFSEISLSE